MISVIDPTSSLGIRYNAKNYQCGINFHVFLVPIYTFLFVMFSTYSLVAFMSFANLRNFLHLFRFTKPNIFSMANQLFLLITLLIFCISLLVTFLMSVFLVLNLPMFPVRFSLFCDLYSFFRKITNYVPITPLFCIYIFLTLHGNLYKHAVKGLISIAIIWYFIMMANLQVT